VGSSWTRTSTVGCEVSLLHPYTSAEIYGLYISHERNIGGVAQIQYEQNSQGISYVEGNKFPDQTNFSTSVHYSFMYFWSTSRSVHISAPYKAILQMLHFNNFFLKFESNFLVKWALFFVEGYFCHGNIGCSFTCEYCITCYPATEVAEIFFLLRLLWSVLICTEDRCLDILPTSGFAHSFQFHNIF
jgi:hypothetical protein